MVAIGLILAAWLLGRAVYEGLHEIATALGKGA